LRAVSARREAASEVAHARRDLGDRLANSDAVDGHLGDDLLDAGARRLRRPGKLEDRVRRHREEALPRGEPRRVAGVTAPWNRDADERRASPHAGREVTVEEIDGLLP